MGARTKKLDRLLATGEVRWARSVSRRAPAEWGYQEIAGRFVEFIGSAGAANLTVTAGLVRDAQSQREPVAWIVPPASTFLPPDLADGGVDLGALAVVRAPDEARALRAADELLRSGAFGLVVLDGVESSRIPMAVQVRLANLAQQHDAALVCLSRQVRLSRQGGAAVGSLASLRAVTFRRRVATGEGVEGERRFEFGFEVVKDKRRGRRWSWKAPCEGPPGLR